MKKEQKKTLYTMGLPIILGTILLIGVSYAWLTLILNGTKTNVLKAGTLSLTLDDASSTGINLASTVPMLDEVGVTTSPYSFTLTNNGDIDSEYTIYLDDVALDDGETRLADSVIKYNLVKDSTSMATLLLNTTGTNPNRVLDSGTIKPGEVYSYDLRLWIDQDATTAISGQVFKGKIRVEAVQIKEPAPTPEQCFEFDSSTGTIILYKCGTKVWNGNSMVDATVENLPDGIDSPITDVVIPKTINGVAVTKIEASSTNREQKLYPFYYMASGVGMGITSVVIPDGVTSIGIIAFMGNKLTSVTIPNSVTTIGARAFTKNQLPDSQAFIYKRNSDGTEDKTTIVNYGGANRDNVIIPEGVTTIDYAAFADNSLTSVVIPNSVSKIIFNAFGGNKLTSVIIQGKSSSADFDSYEPNWGWASGYSDSNITWQS